MQRIRALALSLFCCLLAVQVTAQNFVTLPTDASDEAVLNAAVSVRPTERQVAWQSMEYYAFIHFGTNTFLGKEWGDGTASPSVFNPTALDARQWAQTIKSAGMKGLILTAKHHDGFCLWPTKTTDYSVKSAPWRRGKGDLVREVANACKQAGLKFGIYLSPWDRNHKTYGDSPAYNAVFRAQLTELLTNYGDIFEVWFDGANGEGPNGKVQQYDWEATYALVRKLQPNAVIAIMGPDVRWCGNEAGKGRDPEWSVLPVTATSQQVIAGNSQKNVGSFIPKDATGKDLGSRDKLKGAPALIWYPSEVDVSIRPGWFYHADQDFQVKSPETLEKIYNSSVGMNASLLLNIPPDKRGLIHENDVKNLMAFKKRLDETFRVNMAANAAFSLDKAEALKLTDGKLETACELAGNEPMLTLTFDTPQTFDRILLQENIAQGQRVERFVVEMFDNDGWQKLTEAQTIGYKRILSFPEVTAQKIRIRFTASRSNPLLSELGVYHAYKPILSSTPPMGWMSWNLLKDEVTEKDLREMADAMVESGMRDAGYEYVFIDDGWQGGRDSRNNMIPDPAKFPSGIKALADYVHARGLKLGIYSDAAPLTCGGYTGSLNFEYQDAYRFASWGIDYLKYDYCGAPADSNTAKTRYKCMSDALHQYGPNIAFGICEWGEREPWNWAASAGGQVWRTTGDVRDKWKNLNVKYNPNMAGFGILDIIDSNAPLAKYARKGHWNDMDMLVVGLYGKKGPSGDLGGVGCNDIEYQTQMSLWSMMASPLAATNDLRTMSESTRKILTNLEIIALNQDAACKQCERIVQDSVWNVFVKPLANGDVAVAVLNRGETTQNYQLNFSQIGLTGTYTIRDLWMHQDLGKANRWNGLIQSHETKVFRLKRIDKKNK